MDIVNIVAGDFPLGSFVTEREGIASMDLNPKGYALDKENNLLVSYKEVEKIEVVSEKKSVNWILIALFSVGVLVLLYLISLIDTTLIIYASVGALAPMIILIVGIVQTSSEIKFKAYLNDGRKFMAIVDSSVYDSIQNKTF